MHYLATVILAALTLIAAPAGAQNMQMPYEVPDLDTMQALAGAEHVIPLVRRTRDIEVDDDGTLFTAPSDLRVSLVVLDHGIGTDLSPRRDVYLALWNVVPEFGIAWALEPLAAIFDFDGAERVEAGIYRFTGTTVDYEQVHPDCDFPVMAFTVDARKLSAEVRSAKGMNFGDRKRYHRTPAVSTQRTGCADTLNRR